MADQKRNDARRDEQASTDPLGVDAALRAGQDGPGNQSAASAAEAFEPTARPSTQTASYRQRGTYSGSDSYPDAGRPDTDFSATRMMNTAGSTGTRMMESAGAIGGGAVSATRDVLRGAIGATEDVASDLVGGVTHVAADIVHGVRDIGFEVRDGASGLIGAVGVVGGTAVHTVANLLAEVVGGVRHIVSAAMGHNGDGQAHRIDVSHAAKGSQVKQATQASQPNPASQEAQRQQEYADMPPPDSSRSRATEARI